jgi:hypothetical protein
MKRTTLAILMAGVLAVPVWAQNIEEGDDPDHGVARLSLMSGDVTVQRGDTGEVVAGELNAPLVALDHVLTGPGARAEVQFDSANMIRLGAVSEVRIVELKDNDYFIQVAEGTTTFRVLRDSNTRVEISTPTVSVRPTEKGVYRVTVRPDGATEITVRNGQAEIYTPGGMEILRSGKTMEARGTAGNPEFMIVSARSKDEWDRWNEDRDRDLERSQSYKYVGRDVAGADDLDSHGRWVYDSPYGWVWVPNVTTSWAPYRVGRWSYVNYYGWTWLSGDPWGWAPYHYGRWYSSPYGWAWYPGATLGYRTYWRPALVGFFGWGNSNVSFGVGFGFGNVGWVPLAPYEIYNPWYGPRYRNGINVTNITVVNNTNIVNVYRNARQFNGRNGVTSVQSGNFGRGRVNNDNYVRVTNTDLTRAGRVQGAVPFEQDRDSRRYSDRTPAPDVAARVTSNQNRQFSTSEARSRRAGGGSTAVAAPNTGGPQGGGAGGGRGNTRVGTVDRDSGVGTTRGAPSAPAQSDGWRRFDPGAAVSGSADRTGVTRGADVRSTDNTRGTAGTRDATVNDNNNRTRRGTEIAPREMAPRVEQGSPAPADNGSRNRSRVGESQPGTPVQINPSIVRERGTPSAPPVNTRRAEPSPQAAPSNNPGNSGGGTVRSNPRGDGGNRGGAGPSAPPSGGGGGGTIRSGGGGGGNERGASPAPSGNAGGGRSEGGNSGGGDRGRRR